MSVQYSLLALLVWIQIATNHAVENVTPMQEIMNELEATAKTESNTIEPELECFDLYGKTKCEELRDVWKLCKDASKNLMDEMCRKTCGFCKMKSDCTTSKYKCCKDGVTAKIDMFGSNCPGCRDKDPQRCKRYEKDCNEIGWGGLYMQANCRKTCQFCKDKNELAVHTCSDDKENAKFCKAWKLFGMCDIHASLMREHCTKTCGFCDLDKNGQTNKVNEETVDKKSSQFGH